MPSISTDQFERENREIYISKGKSIKTTRQFAQVLRELRAIGITETEQLNDTAVARWITAWPDRTPQTFQSHLRSLARLCRIAKRRGYLTDNPFADERVSDWMGSDSRPSAPKRRWSKPAQQIRDMLALATKEKLEAQAALDACLTGKTADCDEVSRARLDGWLAARTEAYVHVLFKTGARPGEIQRLRVCDFHPREMEIEIVAHWVTGKSGRRRWWKPKTPGSAGKIAIGPGVVTLLESWCRRLRRDSRRGRLRIVDCDCLFPGEMLWGPWTAGALGTVKELGIRAGVEELTQKAARKGLGTYREIDLTSQGRRELFRHSDEFTGDLYDEKTVDSRLGDAIKIEQFFTGT